MYDPCCGSRTIPAIVHVIALEFVMSLLRHESVDPRQCVSNHDILDKERRIQDEPGHAENAEGLAVYAEDSEVEAV